MHRGESADERNGKRERRDHGRRQALEEQEDDDDDEDDGDAERLLDIRDRVADRDRAVEQHVQLHRRRKLRLIGAEVVLDLVDHIDRVGIRLTIDRDLDRSGVAEPGGVLIVFDAVDGDPDIAQADRLPVVDRDHDVRIVRRMQQLSVGLERDALLVAPHLADRRVGVRGRDGILHIVERQAARRHGVRIDMDAHGEALDAENLHLRHAGKLRDLLLQHRLGIIVDGREGQGRGGER